MKRVCRDVAILFLAVTVFGCGYTILAPERRDSVPRNDGKDLSRPDLSFSRIDRRECDLVDCPGDPRHVTEFTITVRNEGEGDFDGSIQCVYAWTDEDIHHSQYPGRGTPVPAKLHRGDTTMVVLRIDRWFARDTNLRFRIRTDAYPLHPFDPVFFFGRESIHETSYENNGADYVVMGDHH